MGWRCVCARRFALPFALFMFGVVWCQLIINLQNSLSQEARASLQQKDLEQSELVINGGLGLSGQRQNILPALLVSGVISAHEPLSQLLVSPLISPILVPFIIPIYPPLRSLDYSSQDNF